MNIPSGSAPLLICFLAARDKAGETAGVSVQAAAQELRTLHYEPGLPSISALSSVIPERLPGTANADDAPSIRPPILQEMSGESEASGVDEVIFPLATAGRLTKSRQANFSVIPLVCWGGKKQECCIFLQTKM